MDPLSSIALIANRLAVAEDLYRGVQFARNIAQDPGDDAFFVRLITEKARFAEWKRRMGIGTAKNEDIEALIHELPEDARKVFLDVLTPFKKYLPLIERQYTKNGAETPNNQVKGQRLSANLRQVQSPMDGSERSDDILETLRSCNNGLIQIAPPAPTLASWEMTRSYRHLVKSDTLEQNICRHSSVINVHHGLI